MKFMSKKQDAYEKYIKNLEQPGTYADNGCLVAFARLYQVNINIHQLNMPIWTINGTVNGGGGKNRQPIRELHLSYHNGEHYSSIRPIGDRTNLPTNIYMNNTFDHDNIQDNSSSKSSNKNSKNKSSKSAGSNATSSGSYNNSNSSYLYASNNDYDDDAFVACDAAACAFNDLDFNEKVR